MLTDSSSIHAVMVDKGFYEEKARQFRREHTFQQLCHLADEMTELWDMEYGLSDPHEAADVAIVALDLLGYHNVFIDIEELMPIPSLPILAFFQIGHTSNTFRKTNTLDSARIKYVLQGLKSEFPQLAMYVAEKMVINQNRAHQYGVHKT